MKLELIKTEKSVGVEFDCSEGEALLLIVFTAIIIISAFIWHFNPVH